MARSLEDKQLQQDSITEVDWHSLPVTSLVRTIKLQQEVIARYEAAFTKLEKALDDAEAKEYARNNPKPRFKE